MTEASHTLKRKDAWSADLLNSSSMRVASSDNSPPPVPTSLQSAQPPSPLGKQCVFGPNSCPILAQSECRFYAIVLQVKDPEIATTAFPSGGGFSNNFPRPAWQNAAVDNYLRNFVPAYGPDIFNRSGRAYPDVAANGWVMRRWRLYPSTDSRTKTDSRL